MKLLPHWILCLFWMSMASTVTAQNPASISQIPITREILHIETPEGMHHAYEKFIGHNTSIREYLRNGETLESWTHLLTVSTQPRQHWQKVDQFWQTYVSKNWERCSDLKYGAIEVSDADAWYWLYCHSAEGRSLPGAAPNVRNEFMVFHIVQTAQTLYPIFYSWHGDDDAVADPKRQADFIAIARGIINNVAICDIGLDQPCDGVDIYHVEKEPRPLIGPPPCYQEAPTRCLPSITLVAQPKTVSIKDAKTGLIFLNWSTDDLNSPNLLYQTFLNATKNLKTGAPVQLVIIAPAPDHRVTTDERITAGSFAVALRNLLSASGLADPQSLGIQMTNFR